MTARLGRLQRMKPREVRIGTTVQAARARTFHGVMIAYCPDHPVLTTAEALPAAWGLAAVDLRNDPLLDWVAACVPQHLGGDVLPVPSGPIAPARPVKAFQPSS